MMKISINQTKEENGNTKNIVSLQRKKNIVRMQEVFKCCTDHIKIILKL